MRKTLFALVLAIFLAAFGWSVLQKERQLQSGTVMILALQPVDPRSLMQGDYMTLRFAMNQAIDAALAAQMERRGSAARHQEKTDRDDADQENDPEQTEPALLSSQKAVVRLDPSGEAVFVEMDSGRPLAEGEHLLAFKSVQGSSRIGAETFFFQEGHGDAYVQARYAEMRVNRQGKSLLTHLLDENKKRIDPRNAIRE